MKFKIGLSILLLSVSWLRSTACDVCSCGSMAFGMGDFANQGRSLINFNYQLKSFQGPLSQDYFHQLQISGIWALSNNWQVKLSLPWMYAEREINDDGSRAELNGPGDLSLSLQKKVWSWMGNESSHSLYLSAGIQAPTGKFEDRAIESLIAPSFQRGSASWDFLFSLQYEYGWKDYLLVYQSAHAQNTTNRFAYRFGDQWLNSLKAARNFEWGTKGLSMLYLSLDHQYLMRDVNKRGYYQFGTGGSAWLAGLGYQYSSSKWSLTGQYQFPGFAQIGDYQSGNQISLSFNYFL